MADETTHPTPEQVAAVIAELSALPNLDFRERLADNIMDPRDDETAAFRSDELAIKSLAAARGPIDQTNQVIVRRAGESDGSRKRRAQEFVNAVGIERRLLDSVVTGLRARQGIEVASPNPRARAARRLQRAFPVEYLALVREEEDRLRREEAEKKAARRKSRRR